MKLSCSSFVPPSSRTARFVKCMQLELARILVQQASLHQASKDLHVELEVELLHFVGATWLVAAQNLFEN